MMWRAKKGGKTKCYRLHAGSGNCRVYNDCTSFRLSHFFPLALTMFCFFWLHASEPRQCGQPALDLRIFDFFFFPSLFHEIVVGTQPTISVFTDVDETHNSAVNIPERNLRPWLRCQVCGRDSISLGQKLCGVRQNVWCLCGRKKTNAFRRRSPFFVDLALCVYCLGN